MDIWQHDRLLLRSSFSRLVDHSRLVERGADLIFGQWLHLTWIPWLVLHDQDHILGGLLTLMQIIHCRSALAELSVTNAVATEKATVCLDRGEIAQPATISRSNDGSKRHRLARARAKRGVEIDTLDTTKLTSYRGMRAMRDSWKCFVQQSL